MPGVGSVRAMINSASAQPAAELDITRPASQVVRGKGSAQIIMDLRLGGILRRASVAIRKRIACSVTVQAHPTHCGHPPTHQVFGVNPC